MYIVTFGQKQVACNLSLKALITLLVLNFLSKHKNVFAFYLRAVLASGYCRRLRLCVCVCVRPCVNHELVRGITHHLFQLGSPNLDQRCKRPWLRSLLFCGTIDRDLQGQIELQSQNLPHFELVHAITHLTHWKLQFANLKKKMHLSTVQIHTNFGIDWNWSSIQFLISNPDQIELFMYIIGIPVFEIALSTLVDIQSTIELTFGGPALILVDRRNMQ